MSRIFKAARKGFTLLELIVVIVILGILASIAIPTFSGVIAKSKDASATQSLSSLNRNVRALSALDRANRNLTVEADITTAISELRLDGSAPATAVGGTSVLAATDYNKVGWSVSADGSYGLATRSKSGACILLASSPTGATSLFKPAGTDSCTGDRAKAGKITGDADVSSTTPATPVIVAPAALVSTFNATTSGYNGQVKTFTPEVTGLYKIEAWGAQGGNSTPFVGGQGAYKAGSITLTAGTAYSVIVGQQGSSSPGAGGGGGGSFVYKTSDATLLLAAGGGSGAANGYGAGKPGVATESGTTASTPGSTFAGSNGNGGTGDSNGYSAGAGGGWLTSGANRGAYGGSATKPGVSYILTQSSGGYQSTDSTNYAGGFGGGGSGFNFNSCSGGGGGYSGGAAAYCNGVHGVGGGGGSYVLPAATDITGSNGVRANSGSVVFTWAG